MDETEKNSARFRIGLLVNPWAGVGGALAFKGSDGLSEQENLLDKNQITALKRVERFLEALLPYSEHIQFWVCPRSMGENLIDVSSNFSGKFSYQVLAENYAEAWEENAVAGLAQTRAADTQFLVAEMLRMSVDLLVFAGGDGTARDIAAADKHSQLVCLGIPCGVKMHSGVFARNPELAAELVGEFVTQQQITLCDAEVRDIDENALRDGRVNSTCFASMVVPQSMNRLSGIQASKQGGVQHEAVEQLAQQEIAAYVCELIQTYAENHLLIIGPGTTTRALKYQLGDEGSLLGVDVFLAGKLIARDADEAMLHQCLQAHAGLAAHIVVSIPGAQGFVFGRGNQQISARIIEQVLARFQHIDADRQAGFAAIEILASERKLQGLAGQGLFVDTGSRQLDLKLQGSYRVICDYRQRKLCRLSV